MLPTTAQQLVSHATWPAATQHRLAASTVADIAAANRHLNEDVVAHLAATADPDRLATLVASRAGDLTGFTACMDRLRELRAAGLPPEEAHHLDAALSDALNTARDEATARRAAEDVPPGPGPRTAQTLLRLGVKAERFAPHAYPADLLSWLSSPAAADLDDDTVWAILTTAGPAFGDGDMRGNLLGLAAQVRHRPALLERPSTDSAIAGAQSLVAQTDAAVAPARDAHGRLRRWYARKRLLAATRGTLGSLLEEDFSYHHAEVGTYVHTSWTPWVLAALATVPDWSRRQRAEITAWVATFATSSVGADLDWLPQVGRAFGREVPARYNRHGFWLHPWFEYVPTAADCDVTAEPLGDQHAAWLRAPRVGEYLTHALADPDPGVEAARWSALIRLADSFRGTITDLAETARTVAAPAG